MPSFISKKHTLKVCIKILLCILIFIWFFFPFYWALVSSLKSGSEIFSISLLPKSFNITNYVRVFSNTMFMGAIWRSLVIATIVSFFSVTIATLAAYAMSYQNMRCDKFIMIMLLGVKLLPQIAFLAGILSIVYYFNIYDTIYVVIMSHFIITLPVNTWIISNFINNMPIEINESAKIDGASHFMILKYIFMPMVKPILVTNIVLSFISSWNELLFALVLTSSHKVVTIPVAISLLGSTNQYELPWSTIMAASNIITIPLAVFLVFFQKKLISSCNHNIMIN